MGSRSDTGRPYGDALRHLARRPLTEVELRRRLEASAHAPAAIDETIGRLRGEGYVDDRELALHYIVSRATRLGHGPARLLDELERRGVDRAVAEQAWTEAADHEGVEARALLERQVARRLRRHEGKLDERSYARVYNALLRAGYDETAIRESLAPHRDGRPQ